MDAVTRLRRGRSQTKQTVGLWIDFARSPSPPGLLLDDLIFPRAQPVDIDRRFGERHAERGRVLRFVEHSGRVQQRLRRNAAAKRADATRIRIGVDERDLHAKVRGMKRGDVAAGARAYYCETCIHSWSLACD